MDSKIGRRNSTTKLELTTNFWMSGSGTKTRLLKAGHLDIVNLVITRYRPGASTLLHWLVKIPGAPKRE
ncbi:hypothetical protein RRG08_053869 [Elysia crispata]|uniref:Uncharacterized protein n=1 Tax=Elysia crispata TaxID=231223 RepID=A0AAE1D1P8_9GAST|nr:hypothetical protein RRG08_053869 [Elysia crispata]